MNEPFFRRQFASLFSAEHPLEVDEAADQWALIHHNGGHRLAHRLIVYMDERERHTERWHGAFRDWPQPGEPPVGDAGSPSPCRPYSTACESCAPRAPVSELPDAGHYPQIEVPEKGRRCGGCRRRRDRPSVAALQRFGVKPAHLAE